MMQQNKVVHGVGKHGTLRINGYSGFAVKEVRMLLYVLDFAYGSISVFCNLVESIQKPIRARTEETGYHYYYGRRGYHNLQSTLSAISEGKVRGLLANHSNVYNELLRNSVKLQSPGFCRFSVV